jgi:hypothetical protein
MFDLQSSSVVAVLRFCTELVDLLVVWWSPAGRWDTELRGGWHISTTYGTTFALMFPHACFVAFFFLCSCANVHRLTLIFYQPEVQFFPYLQYRFTSCCCCTHEALSFPGKPTGITEVVTVTS